jgi:hypothetical protein
MYRMEAAVRWLWYLCSKWERNVERPTSAVSGFLSVQFFVGTVYPLPDERYGS